jgi:hypothetical protein
VRNISEMLKINLPWKFDVVLLTGTSLPEKRKTIKQVEKAKRNYR